MRNLLSVWIALAIVPGLFGQAINAPDKVNAGEMIPFSISGYQPGDSINWTLIHPREVGETQLNTTYGVEFVVDTPHSWNGTVIVQARVHNCDAKRDWQGEVKVVVGKAVTPPPKPDDPPPDDGDYTGPNKFGVGKIAFDKSPAYSSDIVTMFKQASGYLYAQGGQRKVIYDGTNEARNKTEYNVFVWLRAEMARKGLAGTEWVAFYNSVDEQWRKANSEKPGGLLSTDWFDLFNEIAAGNEARK